MPLGKYYCDYCEKQFQDTAAARRRHIQGVHHQRAKALWYDSLRSQNLAQIHDPDSIGKEVCNRFLRAGSCQYGDSCKYYHPKQNLRNINTQGLAVMSFMNNVGHQGNPGTQLGGEASMPATMLRNQMGTSVGNLPPSLWPPPEGGYPPLPFVDWG